MTFSLGSPSGFSPVGEPNSFVAAVEWVQAALLGTVATTIAVGAVATVGLLMLTGRLNIRRGVTVILGCFILFGAGSIAVGLRSVTAMLPEEPGMEPGPVQSAPELPPALAPLIVRQSPVDPYAGASIQR